MTTASADSPVESVSLYYRDGGSDKVYHASIIAEGTGFLVNFSFGRRGAALQAGTKTAAPVPLDKAKNIYEKLVGEKTRKGYTAQEGAQLFTGSADAGRVSGNVPQLLNDTTETELAILLADDAWAVQTKHDGKRIMVHCQGDSVTGSNRRGLVIPLPQELHDCLLTLPADTILDGELVGIVFYAFDTTRWAGQDLIDSPYSERLAALATGLTDAPFVKRVETSTGADKTAHLERVRASRGEGVVLKRLDAPYRAGRPASGGNQRKFKFTESATCHVLSVGEKKRSVEIGVLTGENMQDYCSVGNVTILPNFPIPPAGALIEVKYLYYYEGGSLYQSVYLGERDDKTQADVLSSLKRKQTDDDE
jgi:bifunctional non-homologous end joining protein LigD